MCKKKRKTDFVMLSIISFVLISTSNICNADSTISFKLKTSFGKNTIVAWNFENVPVGKIPEGWKIEATRQQGPLAKWEVIKDKTAPSGTHVLSLTKINHKCGRTFNLCWTDKVKFLNGEIKVKFKANTGNEDQGGGIMWRVRNKNNYYVARFNPLEDNFRIYYVHNGKRKMIKSAKIALPAGKWHTMKIIQNGNEFEGYLNGKKLIEGKNDLFRNPGGVGLWTKADAATSFDDFTVKLSKPEK